MKKYFILAIVILALNYKGKAQETWYLWIDTTVKIDNQDIRIVSEEPFEITCCLQSPKYRRLLKQTKKWVKNNVDKSYNGEQTLRNIQDLSFAKTMIAEARKMKAAGDNIKFVKFSAICKE